MTATERLIMFLKYPAAGQVKTRLIPKLGAKGAAELQKEMAAHVVGWMRHAARGRDAEVEVRYEGGDRFELERMLGGEIVLEPQGNGDLGDRLSRAFTESFKKKGSRRVVIAGADCPTLTSDVYRRSLDALEDRDVVISPAADGGYCLIGMRRIVSEVFGGIEWGGKKVFESTMKRIVVMGTSVALLEQHRDIDVPEDLPVWMTAKKNRPPPCD